MGRTGQRRRALLVASDRYEAPDLSGLRSPAHDVEALASALSDPEIGAFSVTQVFNRPAHEVNAAIEDFFCEKRPDDVLLLYVSCHGVKDDGGRLYFATTNTRINRLGSTAVASTYVSEQMAHSMSRNIILLLDCCYSGAFVEGMVRRGGPGVGITERLQGSGRAVLSSSSALEYAFELDERHLTVSRAGDGRPSVFTAALVEGLTSGEADHNRDGRISVDELYDFTYARVTAANPHQTPTKYSDVSGELVVAYSPRTAEPPSLPEEVLSAVGHPLPSLRLAVIEALKGLAMGRGKTSTLAKEQLGVLLDDDSRSVAAKARDALDEIEGKGSGSWPGVGEQAGWGTAGSRPSPPPMPPHPTGSAAMSPPETIATGPMRTGRLETGPMRQPWTVPPPRPAPVGPPPAVPPPRPPVEDDRLRAASVLVYFLPLFTGLLFLVSGSRNVKYHAFHCALIDVLTTVYFLAFAIVVAVYSAVRYGTEEIPPGDVVMNFWIVSLFAVPWGLRGWCLVQITRRGTARIKGLGSLARRLVYGDGSLPVGR